MPGFCCLCQFLFKFCYQSVSLFFNLILNIEYLLPLTSFPTVSKYLQMPRKVFPPICWYVQFQQFLSLSIIHLLFLSIISECLCQFQCQVKVSFFLEFARSYHFYIYEGVVTFVSHARIILSLRVILCNFSITGRFVSVALGCLPAEVGLAQLLAETHLGGQAGQRYR